MRRLRRDRSPRHIVTREINTYRSLSFQPRFRCAPRSQRPPFQFLSHYFSHISRRFVEMKSRNRILPNEEEIDTFFFSPLFFFVFPLPSKKLVEKSIELIEERKERERERKNCVVAQSFQCTLDSRCARSNRCIAREGDDKVIKGISLKAITNCRQVGLAPNGLSIHAQHLMICLSS